MPPRVGLTSQEPRASWWCMNAFMLAACARAAWYSELVPARLLLLLLLLPLVGPLVVLEVVLAVMLSGVASLGGVGGNENGCPAAPWPARLAAVLPMPVPMGLWGFSSPPEPFVEPEAVGKVQGCRPGAKCGRHTWLMGPPGIPALDILPGKRQRNTNVSTLIEL